MLVLAVFTGACGSSTTTNVTAPTTSGRCQATVQGSPTTFASSGGTGTIKIGVSRECTWSAAPTAAWIEITSGREGQGEGAVGYRVAPNPNPVPRQGGIRVGEHSVDVSQEAAPCSFQLAYPSTPVSAGGGQVRVDVATHQACRWTASAGTPWITLAPTSGTGPGAVVVNVAANPGAERAGTAVIAGQSISIAQAARAADPPPPPPPPPQPPPSQCAFELSPDTQEFSATGGLGSASLTTGGGCAWTASSSASWLVISSGVSGTGPVQIRYAVAPNLSTSSREATIAVGGAVHRVRQSGVPGGGDDDDDDDDVRLRGIVTALSGSCPALQFTVNGRLISTDGRTDFRRGSCSHVANGVEVEVDGRRRSDGSILAGRVTLFRD